MINAISFSGARSKLNQVEDCALKAKFVKKSGIAKSFRAKGGNVISFEE